MNRPKALAVTVHFTDDSAADFVARRAGLDDNGMLTYRADLSGICHCDIARVTMNLLPAKSKLDIVGVRLPEHPKATA